jgi:hypothetical protein
MPIVTFNENTGKFEYQGYNKANNQLRPPTQPPGAPPPQAGKETQEQQKQEAKNAESDAKELENISQLFEGKQKDKQGNKLGYTQAHINRFNQLSNNEFAFEHVEPNKYSSFLADSKSVVKVPSQDLNVMYKFFIDQGGNGTFEQFRNNPKIIDQVYTATRAKK